MIHRFINSINGFLKSIDFFKSVTLLFAVLVPICVLIWMDQSSMAVSMVMGIFLCSPSDVPGSRRHMSMGILASCALATVTVLIVNIAYADVWILLPVLSFLVFFHSMLSVYGFRASLVSFSGLLAIILSFAHPVSGAELWLHTGLIFLGGLWYLIITSIAHKLVANRHNQLILSECMLLTAEYLHIQGLLILVPDQKDLQNELFVLQTQINEKHEKLREIFISERKRSGSSHFVNRYILIFIELVDILELTIAIPPIKASDKKNHQIFIEPFTDVLESTSQRLSFLAKEISGETQVLPETNLMPLYNRAMESIEDFLNEHQLHQTDQEILMLRNLMDSVSKQLRKLESIERILQGLVDQKHILHQSRDAEKFLSHVDYDPALLLQNLHARSSIFRHAIRLTIAVLIAYGVGSIFHLQNAYWIILTVIVIMRPSYGLTKSRSFNRVIGTLIGGVIALVIVLITQNPIVYGVLSAVSMTLAFSLMQKNYRGSATFITLNIVFLYSLLHPSPFTVIQYRIFDTAIGAALAFLASHFIWPIWEYSTIKHVIAGSLQANSTYLNEISNFYQYKGDVPTSYKLARKEAFLSFGNLNVAFQRMSQEPKSKQQNFSQLYEMIVLNHTFLTAAAALGTFIQNRTTTKKSAHFQNLIDAITNTLSNTQKKLRNDDEETFDQQDEIKSAASYLEDQYSKLLREIRQSQELDQPDLVTTKNIELQELNLISDQLKWLLSLSQNLQSTAETI